MCQRSSDPFYPVSYYIKWVTTAWTYSTCHGSYKSQLKISSNTIARLFQIQKFKKIERIEFQTESKDIDEELNTGDPI